MSSDGFLSRWSRRKQEVREAERRTDREGTRPPESEPPAEALGLEQESPAAALEDEGLSAEEIARLPAPDELTAEMDLSLFLRKGVPEALRKAALRRMWALDPKIRDFVSEAREYAYDWNTPGGVPGSGALPASDEIARMAARIVGGANPAEHIAAPVPSQDRDHSSSPAHTEPPVLGEQDVASGDQGMIVPPSAGAEKVQETEAATRPNPTQEQATVGSPPRRHGGAMPL